MSKSCSTDVSMKKKNLKEKEKTPNTKSGRRIPDSETQSLSGIVGLPSPSSPSPAGIGDAEGGPSGEVGGAGPMGPLVFSAPGPDVARIRALPLYYQGNTPVLVKLKSHTLLYEFFFLQEQLDTVEMWFPPENTQLLQPRRMFRIRAIDLSIRTRKTKFILRP